MSQHEHHEPATPASEPAVTRHCDVVVVGGSAAGLAAALQLGRQRRSVIVVDAGEPRNAPASQMHGFIGRDGTPPAELIADATAEVRRYGVEVLHGRAVSATRDEDNFVVELAAGHVVRARRIVVATGLLDELSAIDGLAAHWGEQVIHCPFCHGYEARDQRIVQIVTHPMGLHTAPLFRQVSADLTVLIAPGLDVDAAEVEALRSAGADVRTADIARVVSTDGRLAGVELRDGSLIEADTIAVGPRFHPRVEPFAALGLQPEPHPTGLGEVIVVNEQGATSVAGVYAVGNVTDPSHQVLQAAAHGSRVGGMVAFDLAAEDVREAARPSAGAADWDQRYSGERLWSGNPNGSLVREVGDLPVGRALDVGAGEGGDALWLAERGWTVTASDISPRALERIGAEAGRRGLEITGLLADANARTPFPRAGFDLVAACYASIPRTPDLRGVHTVLEAVAPGGTLVVLSHDLEAMHDPQHRHRPFDPDAYVRLEDFVAVLREAGDWVIEVDEKRPRPPGSATAHHHVDDLVLRARRA